MNMKKCAAALAVAAGLSLAAAPALAGVTLYMPMTEFQDDDLEWHHDAQVDGSIVGTNGDGFLDVGERLTGVYEIHDTKDLIGGATAPVTAGGGMEVTGVFDIIVGSKTLVVPVGPGIPVALYNFTFIPNTGPAGPGNWMAAAGASAGSMATIYRGPGGVDIDVLEATCASEVVCIAEASDNTYWGSFGFNPLAPDLDNGWLLSLAADDITGTPLGVAFLPSTSGVPGDTNFSLSLIDNPFGTFVPSGMPCNPLSGPGCFTPLGDGLVGVSGTGSFVGGASNSNLSFAASDFRFGIGIPEPGTMLLFGMGLLGIGAMRKA